MPAPPRPKTAANIRIGRTAGPIEWLSSTTLGYAFDRNGQVTLALWDYGDTPRQVTLPVGVPQVTVYDWMGNGHTTPAPGGSLTLAFGPEPVYVVGAAARLWGLHADRPLRMTTGRLTTYPGTIAHIKATVKPGGAPLHGTLTLTLDSRLSLPPATKPINVAASSSEPVDFSVLIPADAETGGYTATLALRQSEQIMAGDGVRLEVDPPVSITSVTPVVNATGKGLAIILHEAQGRPLGGCLITRLEGVPESVKTISFTLPAGGSATFTISSPDLDVTPSRAFRAKVRVETTGGYAFGGEYPVDYSTAPHTMPTEPFLGIGTLELMRRYSPLTLEGRWAVVRSPQFYTGSLTANIRYAWDARGRLLAVDVNDPKFVQENTGPMTWKGDSLQLGFDADPGKGAARTGKPPARRWFGSPLPGN